MMRRFGEEVGFTLSRVIAGAQPKKHVWPHLPGKYVVLDPAAPVAVATLGSVALATEVAAAAPRGLCIVGKVETENIGVERLVKNVIANPAIRFLVCAGEEPPRHLSGATLVALIDNGIDAAKRIVGSPGMRPILPNTTPAEVLAFRRQVRAVSLIGCTDAVRIAAIVRELALSAPSLEARAPFSRAAATQPIPKIAALAPSPDRIKLDKAGYFVIDIDGRNIVVEHYDYKERLLHLIEGGSARAIYWTLISNGWVTQLDHAAYLGKELARAEIGAKSATDFEQDGA